MALLLDLSILNHLYQITFLAHWPYEADDPIQSCAAERFLKIEKVGFTPDFSGVEPAQSPQVGHRWDWSQRWSESSKGAT